MKCDCAAGCSVSVLCVSWVDSALSVLTLESHMWKGATPDKPQTCKKEKQVLFVSC